MLHGHSGISAASVPRFAVRLAQWTGRAACPGVAAFIAFAAKAKSARFESAGAPNLHTFLSASIQVTRRGLKG